jgi:predicted ATP-dependent endonuclease of OLD family
MKIDSVEVKNFRMLKNLSVDLEDTLSLVIGKNNTGKTSFLMILEKFLSGGKNFSIDDLNIDTQNEIVDVTKNKIDSKNYKEIGLSLKLRISYDADKDDTSDISELFLDLDENNHTIVILFEYFLSYEKYNRLFDDLKSDAQKSILYFLAKNIHQYFEIRIRTVKYDDEDNSAETSYDTINKILAIQIISARRDVSNEHGKSNSLSSLSNKYYHNTEHDDSAIRALQETLRKTDNELTEEYGHLFAPIVETIKRFSYTPNESEISIISELGESIFQDTIVKYKHGDTFLPEDYNGLGYLNLMAILFEIYIKLGKMTKPSDGKNKPINLLFIEEPEAHTHPQMQYAFIRHIKNFLNEQTAFGSEPLSLQTIISTHSSHIVSQGDFNDIKYFYRNSDTTVLSKNLKDLYVRMTEKKGDIEKKKQEDAFRFVKQYVTLNRAELFFAEKAILIEGDTERLLVSAMMKQFDDKNRDRAGYVPLLSQNISVIEVGAYSHIFQAFFDFLNIKTLIITDLDCCKNGEKGPAVKCSFSEATVTTNASLKSFFNTDDIQEIMALDDSKKIFCFIDGEPTTDDSGRLRIAFQKTDNGYTARSFEDAFLSINISFISEKKDSFIALKNRNLISDESTDYYKIANECIDSKTGFALDVLINSNESYTNWKTPLYIKEGLEWLEK